MITNLYTIFDTKAKIYQLPFQFHNDAVAIRAAQDILADPTTSITQHPEDYIMFKIGKFDNSTGLIEQFPTHEVLVNFHHLEIPTPQPINNPSENT